MARRRFVAPAREAVDPAAFSHPAFAPYAAHLDLLAAPDWPSIEALNDRLGARTHPSSGVPLAFVAQSQALLADGLHYEQRILERGAIATRERNWHDLLNALVWIEHGAIKAAMNARQVADVARVGPAQRTRAQYALTQFDEAGAIVVARDDGIVAHWDRHEWSAMFSRWRDAPARVIVLGHAILEHLLAARDDLVAKSVVAIGTDAARALAHVAHAIADGAALDDPQSLRPLPLCGIPGWHACNEAPGFIASAPCFAPARSGGGIRPRGAPIAAGRER